MANEAEILDNILNIVPAKVDTPLEVNEEKDEEDEIQTEVDTDDNSLASGNDEDVIDKSDSTSDDDGSDELDSGSGDDELPVDDQDEEPNDPLETTTKTAPEEDDYLDVTDEDLIQVKIDGEIVFKTVKEAKDALSLEGAAQQRLKEATEERKAASAERATGMQELEAKRTELVNTVLQLETMLFQPMVPLPDEALRASDPNKYLLQESEYRKDQERIHTSKAKLAENIQEQGRQAQQNIATYRQEQALELSEKLPILKDPEKGKVAIEAINMAAQYYGFTPNEIGLAADHRIFLMAHDAALYRALKDKKTLTTPKEIADAAMKKRPVKRLRSGVTQRKAKAVQKARVSKDAVTKARRTGKVDDILATILTPARK